MSTIYTKTNSLSATGTTTPQKVRPPAHQGTFSPGYLMPGLLVSLSAGATLTYSVEVTGDDVGVAGYNPATGHWVPFSDLSAQTASAAATLGAAVTAVRLHVTAWTSGTATFQFCQVIV